MKTYKSLISKLGDIMSLTEEEKQLGEDFKIEVAGESRYPDIVFVNAKDKQEAESKIYQIIKEFSDGK